MTNAIVHNQPAYILQQRPYRESSMLAEVFTQQFGKVSLIAKGVRKAKSKTAGLMRTFVPLSLSFVGKADLKTLVNVEANGAAKELVGMAVYCGFYLNELLGFFLPKGDPYPEVFESYQDCLAHLAQTTTYEACLRKFELDLMEHIGYGIPLAYDLQQNTPIASDAKYSLAKGEGLVADANGRFSGAALLAMHQRRFDNPAVLGEAKTLMRLVIDSHLQGKQLKSRSVMNDVIRRL